MLNFIKANILYLILVITFLIVFTFAIKIPLIKFAIYIIGCWHFGGYMGTFAMWLQTKIKG